MVHRDLYSKFPPTCKWTFSVHLICKLEAICISYRLEWNKRAGTIPSSTRTTQKNFLQSWRCFIFVLSIMVATSNMRPLSSWNVANVTTELNFLFHSISSNINFNFNGHKELVVITFDITALSHLPILGNGSV